MLSNELSFQVAKKLKGCLRDEELACTWVLSHYNLVFLIF